MWLSSDHAGTSQFDLLQCINTLLSLGSPELTKYSRCHLTRMEGEDHSSSPVGCTDHLFDSGGSWFSLLPGCTTDTCHPIGPADPFLQSCFLGGQLLAFAGAEDLKGNTLSLLLLTLMNFQSAHFFSLCRSFWRLALPSSILIVPLHFAVVKVKLLKVHCLP